MAKVLERSFCVWFVLLWSVVPRSNTTRLFLYHFLTLRLVSWKVLHRVATCEGQVSRQSVDSDLVEICIQTEKLNDQAMACSHYLWLG